MLRVLLCILLYCASCNYCEAQIFYPDKNGFVKNAQFQKRLKDKGFDLVGAFDTLYREPLLIIAPFMNDGKWGIINHKLEVIQKPMPFPEMDFENLYQEKEAAPPVEQLIRAPNGGYAGSPISGGGYYSYPLNKVNGKYGTKKLDSDSIAIPSIYDAYSEYCDEFVIFNHEYKYGAFKPNGENLVPFEFEQIYSHKVSNDTFCFIVRNGKKFGVYSSKGQEILPVDYDQVVHISYGVLKPYFLLLRNNKMGFINWVSGYQSKMDYLRLTTILNNQTVFKYYTELGKNETMGIINEQEEVVIAPIYRRIDLHYLDKYYKVYKDNLWGLITTKEGKAVTPMKYSYIHNYTSGMAIVEEGEYGNRKHGYINLTGKEVIAPQYDYVENFNDEGFAVVQKDKKTGVINKEGAVIIPIAYQEVSSKENIFLVRNNFKWGIVNEQNFVILPLDNDDILKYESYFDYGILKGMREGKVVLLDFYGNVYYPK